jgi:kinetochore protein Nuf2
MSSLLQDAHMNQRVNQGVAPRQAFSFPLLKIDEICKCLNELGIQVSQDEITNPDKNKEAVQHMFELLAEICTGVPRDELLQPAFAGLQVLNYPDLHEDSIPQLNSFRSCCRMMEICDVQDFTIKDFLAPVANRLRRQLSGIINFAKFREERLLLLTELSSTREGLLDHLGKLKERNDALNTRLSILRDQTSEESKTIGKLEVECNQFEAEINGLNKKQIDLRDETVALKDVNADLKTRISDASLQFEEATILKKKLSAQIVTSPEKFRKQIIEVGQNLQNEQKDAKMAERKVRDLSAWVSNVEEARAEVSAALEAVSEVRSEVERQKAALLDLDAQKQGIVAGRVALTELDQNVHQLLRTASRADEKLQHMRRQVEVRGSEAQAAVSDLHRQIVEGEGFRLQVRRTMATSGLVCRDRIELVKILVYE